MRINGYIINMFDVQSPAIICTFVLRSVTCYFAAIQTSVLKHLTNHYQTESHRNKFHIRNKRMDRRKYIWKNKTTKVNDRPSLIIICFWLFIVLPHGDLVVSQTAHPSKAIATVRRVLYSSIHIRLDATIPFHPLLTHIAGWIPWLGCYICLILLE